MLLAVLAPMGLAQLVPLPVRPKVDAGLASVFERLDRGELAASGVVVLRGDPRDPIIPCLVRVGSPNGLRQIEAAGGQIGSVHGDVTTVRIPASRFGPMAQQPEVLQIEGSYRLYPALDQALPAADVDIVKGYTIPPDNTAMCDGAGVIVGVVDTGIDFAHADFCGGAGDDETRVLWLWDQYDTSGTPPSGRGFSPGWDYGSLYNQGEMDAGSCPHQDTVGHGTHVCGIAAGDGSATGNSQPAYRFVGCADAANLVVVENLGDQFWDYAGYYGSTGATLDAFDFIRTVAANLNRPHVINLSQGTNCGPHDGTTLFEQAINNDVASNSVIAISAGNAGDTALMEGAKHTTGTVTTSDDLTLSLGFSSVYGNGMPVDIWYQGADRLSLRIMDSFGKWHPSSTTWYTSGGGPQTFKVQGQSNWVTPTVGATINGDNRWLVEIADNSVASFYLWQIVLHAENGLPEGGGVHAWIERNYYSNWQPGLGTPLVAATTLGMPACAEDAITVAAWTTKTSWTDIDGVGRATTGTVGDLASFSSRGPLREGTYQKPEATAPGHILASAYSQYYPGTRSYIERDGVHYMMSGTSMSSPMVAGTVALMLQKNAWTDGGTVTPANIKSYLLNNCRSDSYTGSVPNDSWGYGKLDADAAWNAIPTDVGVADILAEAVDDGVRVSWTVTDDIEYVGFNVYRAASIFEGWVKVNDQLIAREGDVYSFVDATVPMQRGHFLYTIKTVGSAGGERPRGSTMIDFGERSPDTMRQDLLIQLVSEGELD